MNGPEHYSKAEDHLTDAATLGDVPEATAWHQRQAQVHATLALAAAVVDGPAVMRPEERDEWDRATGRLEDAS
jgi:hypothetical protein